MGWLVVGWLDEMEYNQKAKNDLLIRSELRVIIEGNTENKFCSGMYVDLKIFLKQYPNPMKAHFRP